MALHYKELTDFTAMVTDILSIGHSIYVDSPAGIVFCMLLCLSVSQQLLTSSVTCYTSKVHLYSVSLRYNKPFQKTVGPAALVLTLLL